MSCAASPPAALLIRAQVGKHFSSYAEDRVLLLPESSLEIQSRISNPDGEAWLPILHTERDGRHYTALYSTARAHDLDKTDDWVVIYLENNDQSQWTVVTESSGPLAGKRVVRDREADCREYYDEQEHDH
jgi:hypothetical protein